jgi:glucan phosphoethanolaminetransferase (alkaline phosphatase superfamily)
MQFPLDDMNIKETLTRKCGYSGRLHLVIVLSVAVIADISYPNIDLIKDLSVEALVIVSNDFSIPFHFSKSYGKNLMAECQDRQQKLMSQVYQTRRIFQLSRESLMVVCVGQSLRRHAHR